MTPLNRHVIPDVPVVFGQKDWDRIEYESWLIKAGYTKGQVVPAKGDTFRAEWTHPTHTKLVVWYNNNQTRIGSACWDGDENRKVNTFPF
jgi:hypothetical protein